MALTQEKMKRSRICNRFMVYFIQDIRFYFSQDLFSKVFFCVKKYWSRKMYRNKTFFKVLNFSICLYQCCNLCFFLSLSDRNSKTPGSILIVDLRRVTGMFLAWFWDSKLSGSTFNGKNTKIVIYNRGQVNGRISNELPRPRWVPKIVLSKVVDYCCL